MVFALDSLFLHSNSNCNAGISFHSVMQNIFKFTLDEKKVQFHKQETSFKYNERVDLQCFTVICIVLAPKVTAKILIYNRLHKLKIYFECFQIKAIRYFLNAYIFNKEILYKKTLSLIKDSVFLYRDNL